MDSKCKKEVVKFARRLESKGLVNSFEGNISCKKDGLIYMTATGKSKCDVTEEWIAVLDEDGKQVDGIYKPTSEYPMHTATYKMRSDINAVIHAHCNFLAAYAICNKPIKTEAYPEMMILFKEIPVVPYGRPGTDEIYKELPKYIEKSDVVLLANHGVLVVGKTLEEAFNKIEAAEAIAKVLALANWLGTPVNLPKAECEWLFNLKK